MEKPQIWWNRVDMRPRWRRFDGIRCDAGGRPAIGRGIQGRSHCRGLRQRVFKESFHALDKFEQVRYFVAQVRYIAAQIRQIAPNSTGLLQQQTGQRQADADNGENNSCVAAHASKISLVRDTA